MIEVAAADKIAVPDHSRSAEVVVNLSALVRGQESGAEQDATARRNVLEPAILDTVVCSAINGTAV